VQQSYTTSLTTTQWEGIEKLIHVQRKSIWPLRLVVEAIFYLTKNNVTWRDLPKEYPCWQTLYWYFRKWAGDGTWELIANELTLLHRIKNDKRPLPTVAIIDSQSVKNTATATAQIGIDGGKLIKGRKRTLLVDTMGHILGIQVGPANQHDSKTGLQLWQEVQLLNPVVEEVELIYADSTFGGAFKQQVEATLAVQVVITRSPIQEQPPDSNMVIHKWRWIVERTLAWLNHNRRLAKDFERTILSAKKVFELIYLVSKCVFSATASLLFRPVAAGYAPQKCLPSLKNPSFSSSKN